MTTNALCKNGYPGEMIGRKAVKQTSRRAIGAPKRAAAPLYPNRINELARERGLTHDDIASALGVNRVTVADWARGSVPMREDRQRKLADLFNVPFAEILEKPAFRGLRSVPVTISLQAGNWAEQHQFDVEIQDTIMVPDDPAYRSMNLYAGKIIGDSMNKVYPSGSIVVLSRLMHRPNEVIEGKRYHIRRTRGGQLVEETIKTLVKDGQGRLWMQPESDSPEFTAILLDNGNEEETIEIKGRVRFAVRKED